MKLTAGEEYHDLNLGNRDDVAIVSLDGASVSDSVFRGLSFGSVPAKKLHLRRVRFERCDLSNADWAECSLAQVVFTDCRLTGLRLTESLLKTCRLSDCKLDLAQFRFAELDDTTFTSCELREADFYQATLKGVRFEQCGLEQTEFYHASIKKVVDFRSSQVSTLKFGLGDLKGARFSAQQLIELSPLLASLAGLRIED